MEAPPEFKRYTRREVGVLLHTTVSYVHRLIREGRIRPLTMSDQRHGPYRFSALDLAEFVRIRRIAYGTDAISRVTVSGPLSNAWPVPFGLVWGGAPYRSVDHAYCANRAPEGSTLRTVILATGNPAVVRALAKRHRIDEHPDEALMAALLEIKFARMDGIAKRAREALLLTRAREIVYRTQGDTYWGVDEETGEGQNRLGHLLMALRDAMRMAERQP